MIFSLEALDAKHGDSLILHYRTSDAANAKPEFMVIDGGPAGVYAGSLEPRLNRLKQKWHPDAKLPIRLLMVSHIDDDHINGVLAMMEKLREKKEDGTAPPWTVLNLWHNSFDNVLGNGDQELFSELGADATVASVEALLPPGQKIDEDVAAVVASVGQGRELRGHAEFLTIDVNKPFKGLVLSTPEGENKVTWKNGPVFTVLGPLKPRIEKLHKKWEAALKAAKKKGDKTVLTAAYADQAVFNLASIVVLAEQGGKTMLLTGDARGDDIIKGLEGAKLLKNGTITVDLLKLPHHGSDRNVTKEFFETVRARHYVFSADGAFDNPEIETFKMIEAARPDDDFTIHLTNGTGKKNLEQKLKNFLAAKKAKKRKYEFIVRAGDSVMVDLLDKVDY